MKDTEYEYSFEVRDLNKYIEYCKANNYELTNKNKQERIIYRNSNKTMGRITINTKSDGTIVKKLDFKEDMLSDKVLIERLESSSLEFADEKAAESILNFLNYKKDNTLIRIRTVYQKNNATFELDEYEQPRKAFVVAIEGLKEEVDVVYNEVKNIDRI